jgi:hypothetical protein
MHGRQDQVRLAPAVCRVVEIVWSFFFQVILALPGFIKAFISVCDVHFLDACLRTLDVMSV